MPLLLLEVTRFELAASTSRIPLLIFYLLPFRIGSACFRRFSFTISPSVTQDNMK